MQYAVLLVFLEKNMALTFMMFAKASKVAAAILYAKSLLGHYRYDYNNGTLSRGGMGTGYRVIISGHMEQDSLGEDAFVVNIRMNELAPMRRFCQTFHARLMKFYWIQQC